MGKGNRNRPASAAGSVTESVAGQVSSLKDEGNKLFGGKEYTKAFDAYEKAIKLLPAQHADSVLLHSNKAACSMMLKKYKEAVNECTSALEVAPDNQKALLRRAKALEAMGLYKQALGDVQKANKADDSAPENQATEKRLKDILAGKKPAGAAGTLASRRKAGAAANGAAGSAQQRAQINVFQAKCTLGDETRNLHVGPGVTYAEMLEGVRMKFDNPPPFMLKYLDRDGDQVTVTSRGDLQRAMADVVNSAASGPRLSSVGALPPIRLTLVPCAESEVPQPPAEEIHALQQMMLRQAAAMKAHQEERQRAQQDALQQQQGGPQQQDGGVIEIDQWIVDFAHLFRDSTGVEFDKHIELNNLGWDKIQEAMDETMRSDKAIPLLDAAADKFAEVTISGLTQWGHVFTVKARKHLDDAAADGKPIDDVRATVEDLWAQAEKKYNEALAVKGEHVDTLQYLASLEMDRAKLAAGLNVGARRPADKPEEEKAEKASKTEAEAQKEQQEVQRELQEWTAAAQCKAIDALSPEQAKGGDGHWKKCFEYVERMVAAVPENERKVRPKAGDKAGDAEAAPSDAKADMSAPAAENKENEASTSGDAAEPATEAEAGAGSGDEYFMYAQVLLNWGNFLYERSQLAARSNQEWRPLVDEAVQHFRDAGCAESDIRGALKNHYCADQLDLGPDPEPEQPAEAAKPTSNGTAAKSAEPEPKGLPSLGPKPKKTAA
mmetsp:Transcript_14445/g.43688  ORF Transcript_14445/g.43688 Transcript_14445/m.43688 type:complete len:721 (-) Transcript_14445:878-3040(-)